MSSQEKWDERYRENDLPWETGHASTELQRVLAEETIDRGRAIDIGCGTGANAVLLAQQGFEVVGVDFSPTAIERALARAGEANAEAEFVVADLLDPPDLGEPFTFFFDRGCYHVLRRDGHTADYFKTLARWTVPGARGLVLAGNAREKQEPGPPVVSEEELRADWETLFTIHWLREIRFDQNLTDTMRPLGWSAWVSRK